MYPKRRERIKVSIQGWFNRIPRMYDHKLVAGVLAKNARPSTKAGTGASVITDAMLGDLAISKHRAAEILAHLFESGHLVEYAMNSKGEHPVTFAPGAWQYPTKYATANPHSARFRKSQNYRAIAAISKVQPRETPQAFERGLRRCSVPAERLLWFFLQVHAVPVRAVHERYPLRWGCVYFQRQDFCNAWGMAAPTFDKALRALQDAGLVDIRFRKPLYMIELLPEAWHNSTHQPGAAL